MVFYLIKPKVLFLGGLVNPVTEVSYYKLNSKDQPPHDDNGKLRYSEWDGCVPMSVSFATLDRTLTKCTTHIIGFKRKPAVPAKWNLEKCIEAGKNFKSRAEFKKKFHYPYEKARLNGWLNQCCVHMV